MLHQALWDSCRDLAEDCLTHPFVRGLAQGTLDPAVFRDYVAQDAFYLRAFMKSYALALARCDEPGAAQAFHELIGGVLQEMAMHREYARTLGVKLAAARPNAACLAYTDFLLATAWGRTLGEILAAMTPCMRLYAWLGQNLARQATPENPYRRWIETYGAAEFDQLAARIESLLDAYATDSPEIRDAYRYAMECELRFFSAVMPALTV